MNNTLLGIVMSRYLRLNSCSILHALMTFEIAHKNKGPVTIQLTDNVDETKC